MKSKWKSFCKYPLGCLQGREFLLTNTAKSFLFTYEHHISLAELNIKWKLSSVKDNAEHIKMAGIYLRAYNRIENLLKKW